MPPAVHRDVVRLWNPLQCARRVFVVDCPVVQNRVLIGPIRRVADYFDNVLPKIDYRRLRLLATLGVDECSQLFRCSVADQHLWRWIKPVLLPEDGLSGIALTDPLHVKISRLRHSASSSSVMLPCRR